ncbi:choice-of-anchor Q domain-containing protein [Agromyces tardus]|uniref:choice-of-anchor Q domain-containing protein n=1 Tax=Agromyces tardus TaxID=2583849 RepID=UPI0014857D6C|nr:choice-of-anchor Q domain-containing protein [Agromyces tardus]
MRAALTRVRPVVVPIAVAGLAVGLMYAVAAPPSAARADSVITVDSTAQGLGVPGCTLPEAILAANHDASWVPLPASNGLGFETGCAAGSGSDLIDLAPGTYAFPVVIDDASNYVGPTATPIITSTVQIEGHGALIQHTGSANVRAFAVLGGDLVLNEVHVQGFAARGGNGASAGGGGGLGAGGAIYVHDGSLLVQWSTFEGNSATGGNGGGRTGIGGVGGGGGGGLGGNGGANSSSGGGGGGARTSGASGGLFGTGGGGGGTLSPAGGGSLFDPYPGGYRCGGEGGVDESIILDEFLAHSDGDDAECAGGGGGGGADFTFSSGDGGDGGYGGGGGGGAWDDGDGGLGGFGGGGGGATVEIVDGCGYCGGTGGGGGFGGGGGNGPGGFVFGGPGDGGTFGGHGSELNGGGGAGLGGAIFGHSSTIAVINSTFTGNYAVRGVAGTSGFTEETPAANGADAGGALFAVGGTLTVTNSTVAGNESTGDGAGIVVYRPLSGEATSFVLRNTIVAGNSGRDECFVLGGVATSGTNNLVTPHDTDVRDGCPTITQTADPQLGALALNAPGRTPTMAIGSTSSAYNTGNLAFAPTDDQRGVSRPRYGSADIGAYEYVSGTDFSAPTSSPTIASGSSLDGWNTTAVTIDWGWADGAGSAGIDPDNCTLQSTSTGEGSAIVLTATCADLAGNVATATRTVKVDTTDPTVTCATPPTYVLGSTPTSGLSATVTDELSGPVASPVTATVSAGDVTQAGAFTKPLTGEDVAGNDTTVDCGYLVAYDFRGFQQPIPQSSYKRGSTIPVRFQLADAGGVLSDAAAAALLSPTCRVSVTLDGQVKGCAKYNATSDTFQFDVKTTKGMTVGTHTIGILVTSAAGDVVNSNSTQVVLR